ncbi:hypothetical protein GCM10010964_33450 [Caldovatus sediminis]|uniref:Uncharacterized protein n=1 Tax=Caldovatus sediminis TaxID=2041189 RepID=A0A8J2ZDL9_9PROT|nr:hypothetical protein [Caldovatus sediminis]GGG43350.1 hypothetical protein GCM10010964_33450 [Caldovatus sediminis]
MAIEQWKKDIAQMRREAISAIAELASGRQQARAPARETAALAIVAAHQIPELVEAGEFRPGDLDDVAMRAMATVVDIAAGWDEEQEDLEEYVGSLAEDELRDLIVATGPWARGVWETMVPLDEEEKRRTMAALRD